MLKHVVHIVTAVLWNVRRVMRVPPLVQHTAGFLLIFLKPKSLQMVGDIFQRPS